MKRELYNIKIEAGGDKAYDKISSFLSGISFESYWNGTNLFYYLDKTKQGIARLSSKTNTIELTDKVDWKIVDCINHIKKQGGTR
jgi:hypothetical protein